MTTENAEAIINLADVDPKPLILREPLTWRERGACRGLDPNSFFADRGGTSVELVRRAKLVCSTCVVRISCLNFAVDNQEKGVWGGTTEKERRIYRRQVA